VTGLVEVLEARTPDSPIRVPDPTVQPVMAVKEVQTVFPVSRATIYEAIRRGDLPAIRIGQRWFIPTAAVRRLLCLDLEEEGRGHA
jgi:excisionase family DNA binding protein